MPNYRRAHVTGGTFFFTVVTHRRRPLFADLAKPALHDWSNVSMSEVRKLSDRMFDAANVPTAVRSEYYRQFEAFLKTLQ